MKKIRLLIDAHVFDGKHQGTRTYLKGLYKALIEVKDASLELYFAANDTDNLKKEFGEHPNVFFLRLKTQNKFYRLLVEFPQLIRKFKIDYSHFQYITPLFKVNKYIVTSHDILFQQKEFKKYFPSKYRIINGFLFRKSAKQADILLTVSQYSKKQISKYYSINEDTILITPNSISESYYNAAIENFKPKTTTKFGKYVLYVSRVEPRKNHISLLKAFVELKLLEKGYNLIFIGKKDINDKDLNSYISDYEASLKNHLFFIENIDNTELINYYLGCEVFVFPSYAEGFGIPPLEAMALGKKVLCSNSTAMSDFNLPDELTFNPNHTEELKQKLLDILKSEKDYSKIYAEILNRYNWNDSATTLLNSIIEDAKR